MLALNCTPFDSVFVPGLKKSKPQEKKPVSGAPQPKPAIRPRKLLLGNWVTSETIEEVPLPVLEVGALVAPINMS